MCHKEEQYCDKWSAIRPYGKWVRCHPPPLFRTPNPTSVIPKRISSIRRVAALWHRSKGHRTTGINGDLTRAAETNALCSFVRLDARCFSCRITSPISLSYKEKEVLFNPSRLMKQIFLGQILQSFFKRIWTTNTKHKEKRKDEPVSYPCLRIRQPANQNIVTSCGTLKRSDKKHVFVCLAGEAPKPSRRKLLSLAEIETKQKVVKLCPPSPFQNSSRSPLRLVVELPYRSQSCKETKVHICCKKTFKVHFWKTPRTLKPGQWWTSSWPQPPPLSNPTFPSVEKWALVIHAGFFFRMKMSNNIDLTADLCHASLTDLDQDPHS